MKIISHLVDTRVGSKNLMIEASVGEYLSLIRESLDQNEYQRRKIKTSNTVYSLLKDDFQKGCVLPPLVLALRDMPVNYEINELNVNEYLVDHRNGLVIIDGLQRTFTLLTIEQDLKHDPEKTLAFMGKTLRLELYLGMSRVGILYRMLTLNTGQSPMSLRQQIEMLYMDLSGQEIDGIKLIKEVDDEAVTEVGEYSFRSVVDGFNSYIDRSELPIDRFDILETIKSLENLSHEATDTNLFAEYCIAYHALVLKLLNVAGDTVFKQHKDGMEEEPGVVLLNIDGRPFGDSIRGIFAKSQPLTGFGSAIGRLRDKGFIDGFVQIKQLLEERLVVENPIKALSYMLSRLDVIRRTSKKIGNSQRLYFQFLFRELLNPQGDYYLNFDQAVEEAYRKYESQVL
jgi:hypothetical protein